MSFLRVLSAALTTALVGCSGSGSVPPSPCTNWHVQPGFSDKERSDIELAAVRWNVALGDNVLSVDEKAEPFCTISPMTGEETTDNTTGGNVVGNYTLVFITLRHTNPDVFEIAATHEFGHALGMSHISGVGIMSALQGSAKITPADAQEAERVGWPGVTPEK